MVKSKQKGFRGNHPAYLLSLVGGLCSQALALWRTYWAESKAGACATAQPQLPFPGTLLEATRSSRLPDRSSRSKQQQLANPRPNPSLDHRRIQPTTDSTPALFDVATIQIPFHSPSRSNLQSQWYASQPPCRSYCPARSQLCNSQRETKLTSSPQPQTSIGTGYDLANSIFSPDGRNFQVEYAVKAVENGGTSVGIRCKDGVVLAVEKIVTSKLLKSGANKRIATVDRHLGVVSSLPSLRPSFPTGSITAAR